MDLTFASRQLERCYTDEVEAARTWGPQVGRRYIERVTLLYKVRSLQELMTFRALRLHPLKGDRANQWAMMLQGRWRLIVELQDARTLVIREVTNHYGD
ncbi:MAG: type II toxin-antitoxin system RelE/ParE family toxin [Chloroflexi bacterium]|nr:type II toxin-antitoxin system RelE/ParE family toxin [Chloroflexota bacterium]